ncbi:hypothetical protein [Azonexus sp.]|jgi:hypothetical protein|nr:hypothetical protein [Azonexus sp.]
MFRVLNKLGETMIDKVDVFLGESLGYVLDLVDVLFPVGGRNIDR